MYSTVVKLADITAVLLIVSFCLPHFGSAAIPTEMNTLLKAGAGFVGNYARGLISKENGASFQEGLLQQRLDKEHTQVELLKQALHVQYESFDAYREPRHEQYLLETFHRDAKITNLKTSFPSQSLYRDKMLVNIYRMGCGEGVSKVTIPRITKIQDLTGTEHDWIFDPSMIVNQLKKVDQFQVEYYHIVTSLENGQVCSISKVADIWALPKIRQSNAFSETFENKDRHAMIQDLSNAVKLVTGNGMGGAQVKTVLDKFDAQIKKPAIISDVTLYELVDLVRYVAIGDEDMELTEAAQELKDAADEVEDTLGPKRPICTARRITCIYSKKSLCSY